MGEFEKPTGDHMTAGYVPDGKVGPGFAVEVLRELDEAPARVRVGRDTMFLVMASVAARRGTCPRAQVGVILVQERRPVAMGYNGAPPGLPHCTEVGCEESGLYTRVQDKSRSMFHYEAVEGCQRAIHAEANAIAWASRAGTPLFGATMYSTHSPCQKCAELILSAGIGRFVFKENYRAERLDLLNSIEVVQL